MQTSQVRRRYYNSAQVCAQTWVHSLFPNSYSPMDHAQDQRLLCAFRGTEVSHHQLPNSARLLRIS